MVRYPREEDSVYRPGHDPWWFRQLYLSRWWVTKHPNGMIIDIDEFNQEAFVEFYDGDFDTIPLDDFKVFNDHMWWLD